MGESKAISHPVVVLCEGRSDANVIDALKSAGLIAGVDVRYPGDIDHAGEGKDAFGKYLVRQQGSAATGWDKVRHVVVIADADNDHEKAFRDVVAQAAAHNYVSPSEAWVPTQVDGSGLRQLHYGSDGGESTYDWTPAERLEVADCMIARWKAWAHES